MLRARHLVVGLALCWAQASSAFDPFTVRDIRVEGLQRTEPGTIFGYLPVKVGERMTDEGAARAIRALYATGFFTDVRLEVDGDVLIVTVQERPAIASVEISGSKEFSADQLRAALRSIGLSDGRIFDKAQLERAEQEIKRQYINRGRYAAQVQTTVTPLERNRVGVSFQISEGDVARIRQINFVGNKVFSESTLLGLMKQRTPGWLTWYSKLDQYSRDRLSADLETIRSHYQNRGYLEFTIESTQVQITPDRRDIFITINVIEGERYTVSDVRFAGDLLLPEADLRRLLRLKSGETFSRERLTESTKAMTERLGDEGYAFANVNAVPEIDKQNRTASFTFFVDPGRRVYVRRVNIAGNTRTRDEVIRREIRQFEGGWYNAEALTRSRRRVDRLGYFSEVNIETPAVPGANDQVDVNVSVVERATGNLLFGVGFASGDGLILQGSVSQNNIFGSGNALAVQLNTGRVNRTASISFTNPYFTSDGVSAGFDVYRRTYDPSSLGLGNYLTKTAGLGFRLGLPVTEDVTLNVGLTTEQTDITTYADSPKRYIDFVNTFGPSNLAVFATVGFAIDRRDSRIYTTRGTFQRAFAEVTIPGSDLEYYRLNYIGQYFLPLTRDVTLQLTGDIGVGNGLGGKPLPFYRNYFVGGINSVRGYATGWVGPRDPDNIPIGGSHKMVGNAELLFPFPGLRNDRSVRLSTFFDAGYADDSFTTRNIRYSTGLAVTWISPFGPLKLSIAKPLNNESTDRLQRFQFTFGSVF
ncbi:MAG: outer membrane protein assembly factor BamA [Rhodocyclaceae bacterium]|jgi:outer membrane protein insertion porin family|nr:outer membrane protein assembly factor BamA [Rhodocyclaceae bacterium]MCE2978575.1 outer membrane protein assembly factor BamA [Betaproteobacteria bacterium]MCA3074633.1 outer membrane protein assembly factor BamA [Rhodocyclaceae bacterium]MCA3088894.1 outer membrane protein assembly factor BamA [Rhodocyclaceae bacterium]MCA3095630.1 outer membrane protein assembly factor BamA [Rhodocyclaceae bacterium]